MKPIGVGALFIVLLSNCTHSRLQPPTPLSPEEASLTGCYELLAGPWSDTASANSFGLKLDSLGSSTHRRLLLLAAPVRRYRYAFWTSIAPDSVSLSIVTGVEGQGFDFRVQRQGDTLTGIALRHGWPGIVPRTAPVRGSRHACTSGDR